MKIIILAVRPTIIMLFEGVREEKKFQENPDMALWMLLPQEGSKNKASS